MPAVARPLNLVCGASGYIGTNLVPALQAAGRRVRATARHVEVLEARAWHDVECVPADALAPETLERALDGVDTLMMEVTGPGAGVLEFVVEPTADGGASITSTAYWHPAGVPGLLYWYVLVPAHRFIFTGLTRAILRRATRSCRTT